MLLDRCPWYVAGPLLGLIIVGLRAAVNKPLGALGGYIDLALHAVRPRDLGFGAMLIAGTALGGILFSLGSGTFALTPAYDAGHSLLSAGGAGGFGGLVLAGVLIGVGARTAGGCTSGHGLCGVAVGSKASLVATLTFFATAVLLAHLTAWMGGGGR
jgi:hypothetical protein